MDLRCKVFRGSEAGMLEADINHFLSDEIVQEGQLQLEEITQSEGPGGVTITLWYSLTELEPDLDDEVVDARSMEVS